MKTRSVAAPAVPASSAAPGAAAGGPAGSRRAERSGHGMSFLRRAGALAASLVLLASAAAAGLWSGPPSDHFDGKRFHNLEPMTIGVKEWLKLKLTGHRGPWRKFTHTPPGPPPQESVSGGRLSVTFVNHATLLLQMDGKNVLTDPIWSERAAPILGQRRHRPPGIRFEDLPPIHAVLVSHDHHDHMDLPTLRRLAARFHPAILVGLGNASFLARRGIAGARELDWWQSVTPAPGLTVTAVPARHMSGRGPFGHDRTLWCGFVVSSSSGSAYFAGDTGRGAHFEAIGRRFPGLRLALLPIGGFTPLWYMREQHLGPEDAVAARQALGAGTAIPMHFGTFPNGDDAETEPLETLRAVLSRDPREARRWILLDNGASAEVPRAPERAAAGECQLPTSSPQTSGCSSM